MSNFVRMTKRPGTDRFELAIWLDDFFESHAYGVQFPDGTIYAANGLCWEFQVGDESPRSEKAY